MKKDGFFYGVILAGVASFIGGTLVYIKKAPFSGAVLPTLNTFHTEQLQLFRDRNTLMTTLASLIFGAVGALIFNLYKNHVPTLGQQRWALLACLSAGLSLYFGYLSYEEVIWMLSSRFFDLKTLVVDVLANLQLGFFTLSTLFLGGFFLSSMQKGGGK